ncbi:hypothetical protein EJ07DRAFT_117283 [Lizonia empirigonia]|nr:hypothetical protein EJ07DRAFT_117283 [Lizonia empirigonia]
MNADIVPSPLSRSSSDTLHENDTADHDRKYSNISPFSTATLNFEDLKIYDDISYTQKSNSNFASPFQRTVESPRGAFHAYRRPVQHLRQKNYHTSPGNGIHNASGNRNTSTWMSEEARATQEFLVVRNSMKRQFKNADVAKWKITDYVAHREAMMASAAKKRAQQAQGMDGESALRVPPIAPQKQDMMRRCGLTGNLDQVGNYGRALGEKTIWCQDWESGKEEVAPWPCMAEMKWEGDDRAKTSVGRYLPLPREQGPVGIPWSQLQVVEQYPLDQVARIPTMEDVFLPVDEIDDEVKYDLLTKDLEDAMDAHLES